MAEWAQPQIILYEAHLTTLTLCCSVLGEIKRLTITSNPIWEKYLMNTWCIVQFRIVLKDELNISGSHIPTLRKKPCKCYQWKGYFRKNAMAMVFMKILKQQLALMSTS